MIELIKNGSLDFRKVFWKTKEDQISWSTSGIARFVARNFAPSTEISCSYGLNGSDPEQIVHEKVGILSLESINTWNAIFDVVMWIFSYDEKSPRKYLHKHIKHTRDQRYKNIIYRSMLVTKESDNNMQYYNITSIWERNQLCINKWRKSLQPMP